MAKINLLQKQGFYNSIILYAGTFLGFFNIILFNRILTLEQYGFFMLMVNMSLLYAQIASLGIGNVILKYFPYYSTPDRTHRGFGKFILQWSVISFVIFTLLFIVFKNPIIKQYQGRDGASLMVKYYYYLVPISFLTMMYAVFESMARAIFKNILSAFLKEVILKVFTTVSILLIGASIANYHNFLMIYLAANAAIAIILGYSIYRERHFKLAPVDKKIIDEKWELVRYGVFTVLSGSSFALIQNLDIIMLSVLTVGSLKLVGIYNNFFAIAIVISLPAKAMNRTSLQIVAQAFAEDDLPKIGKIYHKTSVVQMLVGCLIFIGLIVNKEFIMALLNRPQFAGYFDVFIIVGIGFLVDITGGLNGYIINVSKYYRLFTYMIVISVGFCLLSNWLLIPHFGMIGAALSYSFTMFSLNLVYWWFVKAKFGLQPFGKPHILILMISAVALAAGCIIPYFSNTWINMIVRSATIVVVYSSLAYLLNISEDINTLLKRLLASFKKILKQN